MTLRNLIATLLVIVPAAAAAQPVTAPVSTPVSAPTGTPVAGAATAASGDDGYCDFVEGAAAATAATLFSPQLFGQFGYIEQPAFTETPQADTSNLRLLGGARWSLSNIYAGSVTKARARAECRRHRAVVAIRGISTVRANGARVQVYEHHMAEAQRMMQAVAADLEARRATLVEANAMRMRLEQMRATLAEARREVATVPPQQQTGSVSGLLAEYRNADADVERNEGKLRSAQAYDVSVRFGVDRFLEGANSDTRYFGVVQVGLNLGLLFTGSGNRRAANGRSRYTRSGNDPVTASTRSQDIEQLRQLIAIDTERASQAQSLVTDLGQQIDILTKMGTEDAKRLRDTLWFDWVRAKADHAYLQANIAAMQELIGMQAQAQ